VRDVVARQAAVLLKDVDLSSLPAATPAPVRRLIRRCLEKDPQRRLRDIGEARFLLGEVLAGTAVEEAPAAPAPVVAVPAAKRGVAVWIAAAFALVALIGFFLWQTTRSILRPMIRLSADLGPDAVAGLRTTAIISPDGRRLVFPVRSGNGTLLATQLLDQSKYTVLAGTEGAVDPFFKPDGEWIGFIADRRLKKISVLGGAAVTLCEAPGARGAAWGEDGTIIANLDLNHLFRLTDAGGKAEMLRAKPEDHNERTWRWPQILPGGENVLVTGSSASMASGGYEDANLEVLSLRTGKVTLLHRGGYFGRYLPSGHLTYVHQGTLFAVPFDLAGLKIKGTPAPVLEDVAAAYGQGGGQLDFARNGTLVYLNGKSPTVFSVSLAWMDSAGKTQALWTGTTTALTPRLSPDGKLVAASIRRNISVYDPQRDAMTPLTFNGADNADPVWTRDGKHIVYIQTGPPNSAIWWISSDGSGQPERLFEAKTLLATYSFSPDGRRLAFAQAGESTGLDLWTLPLDLGDPEHPKPGKPELFLREPDNQLMHPAFSPDGRWIAYMTNQGGTQQIFVRPYPNRSDAGKWQISTSGGDFPVWSRAGKELLYLGPDVRIMAVSYAIQGDSLVPDKPRVWCPMPVIRTGMYWNFDLAPDGKRVLVFPRTTGRCTSRCW
jgi:serine/threonine-protein kinase